jgi:hypothetical protein
MVQRSPKMNKNLLKLFTACFVAVSTSIHALDTESAETESKNHFSSLVNQKENNSETETKGAIYDSLFMESATFLKNIELELSEPETYLMGLADLLLILDHEAIPSSPQLQSAVFSQIKRAYNKTRKPGLEENRKYSAEILNKALAVWPDGDQRSYLRLWAGKLELIEEEEVALAEQASSAALDKEIERIRRERNEKEEKLNSSPQVSNSTVPVAQTVQNTIIARPSQPSSKPNQRKSSAKKAGDKKTSPGTDRKRKQPSPKAKETLKRENSGARQRKRISTSKPINDSEKEIIVDAVSKPKRKSSTQNASNSARLGDTRGRDKN